MLYLEISTTRWEREAGAGHGSFTDDYRASNNLCGSLERYVFVDWCKTRWYSRPGGAGNKPGNQGSAGARGVLIDGCPNRSSFEPIASEPRTLPGNGKPDDLCVPICDVRGRRNPAGISLHDGGRMGWRWVTQLVERCHRRAVRGALPPVTGAPGQIGTNSSGSCRAMLARRSWRAMSARQTSYRC